MITISMDWLFLLIYKIHWINSDYFYGTPQSNMDFEWFCQYKSSQVLYKIKWQMCIVDEYWNVNLGWQVKICVLSRISILIHFTSNTPMGQWSIMFECHLTKENGRVTYFNPPWYAILVQIYIKCSMIHLLILGKYINSNSHKSW